MNEANSNAPSYFLMLQMAFLILKLTGNIGWHWIWVVAPTWGVLFVSFMLASLEPYWIQWMEERERKKREETEEDRETGPDNTSM